MRIWCLRPLWGRTRSRVKSPSARVNRRSTANSVFATEPSGRTQSLMEMMACSSLPSGPRSRPCRERSGRVRWRGIPFRPGAGRRVFECCVGHGAFRDEDHAAGFAVEAVDEMGGDSVAEVQAHAADEAGINVPLGGMADEAGGLVDGQQVGVFMEDGEQFGHHRSLEPRADTDQHESEIRLGRRNLPLLPEEREPSSALSSFWRIHRSLFNSAAHDKNHHQTRQGRAGRWSLQPRRPCR